MGQTIALEAQTLGVNQLFAPVVDLARELRYGRVSISRAPRADADHKHADWITGRGNLLGRSVPRRRDWLQLRQGPAEQERLVNGQALCGIQQPGTRIEYWPRSRW